MVKLIDAELKEYKKQVKLEMRHSGFKGVFQKTELYKDMPEPTPQPETTHDSSTTPMTEDEHKELKEKEREILQQYAKELSVTKTSSLFRNKLFLIGLAMMLLLVVFVTVLRLAF